MLKVDLAELGERGSVPVQASVPADHVLWSDTELGLKEAVGVDFTATGTATGQVVVHGRIRAILDRVCRRCLEEIRYEMEEEVSLVYAPVDELAADPEDEIRPLETVGGNLDLATAVREETILAAPVYTLCRPDCKGLCPRCGANRNHEDCDCVVEEPDPRWDALRALRSD